MAAEQHQLSNSTEDIAKPTGLKVWKITPGVNLFRCVFLFLLVWELFPEYIGSSSPIIGAIIIPWGFALLLIDIFYKRFAFKSGLSWILFAFLTYCALSFFIINNYDYRNLEIFLYWVLLLLVIYPFYNETNSIRDKYKIIFYFTLTFIIPITLATIQSLWFQVSQSGFYSDSGIWYGYAIGNNRLRGMYLNANTAGVVSLITLALLVLCVPMIKELFMKKAVVITIRAISCILILIHLTMLTLSSSRASLLAFLLFILLFSFFALFKVFHSRIKYATISVLCAVLTATIITSAVYITDYPIRAGVALVQHAITSQDPTADNSTNVMNTGLLVPSEENDEDDVLLDIVRRIDGNWLETVIDGYDNGRMRLWRIGIEIIKEYPLFGVTPQRLTSVAGEINRDMPREIRLSSSSLRTLQNSNLHNSYIQLAVTCGIPALVLFLLFLFIYAVRHLRALFISIQSEVYYTVAGILSFIAALAFWNLFETQLFVINYYSTVIFWSCLSFGGSLLTLPDNISVGPNIER